MIRRNTTLLETAPPQTHPYGILSPATTCIEEPTEDWIAGFTYETSDASVDVDASTIRGSTTTDTVSLIQSVDGPTHRLYYPFDVQASVEASTMGNTPEEIQASAEAALEVVTQKAIETEFWRGDLAKKLESDNDNRYLSHVDAQDVTPTAGTAVKVRYGQALLEQALGNATIGSLGVIHAPLLIASILQTEDKDGALTTNLGTKVVAGAGYSNIGPGGTVAPTGQSWMYATGPVTVRLGAKSTVVPEQPRQAVDTSKNTIKYYIDRPAAITWSTTGLYAVLVDLTLDYA